MMHTADGQAAPGQAPGQAPGTERGDRDLPALGACLIHASDGLGCPVSRADVEAACVGDNRELGIRAAIELGERRGLRIGFGKLALAEIDQSIAPAILILSHDRAVVVEGCGDRGTLVVYDPELGGGSFEVSQDRLAAIYTGYALLPRIARNAHASSAGASGGHWFWTTLAQNRWIYAQVMIAAMVANILALPISLFTMVVYDRVIPNEAVDSLVALTIGVGAALVFDFVIKTVRAAFVDRAGKKADKQMGMLIFDQLLDLRMRARKGSVGAIANTMREFETLREFFASATVVAVVDIPFIFIFVAVIYLIGGPLALVPLLAIPAVLILGLAVQPILARLAERSFAEGQIKQTVLVEAISGLETIKAVGASRRMKARWEDAVDRQSDHGVKSRAVTQFALNGTAFVQQFAQIAIVFYGVFLIMEGTTSMGALIASVILMGRALAPLAQIAQTLTRLNAALTSYRSINALMKSEREHPGERQWLSRPYLSGDIVFENVSFSYQDDGRDTLRNVSFRIKAGEKVAILGQIGSGKSTIARLILGLYEQKDGSVLVDGTDIRQIDPIDLRRNIGSVLQDIWLLSGTVRENIALGAYRPSDEDVLAAAKIAGVDDFISRNPAGYDLKLAERGEGLSGGQRQAIALARALVGRPPILLLDEPTASMDVQTERQVIRRLREEAKDRTVVVITHRVSLLDLVDRVIVIDNGQVAVDGPKSVLNSRSGVAQPVQIRPA
jgi:ATP-binding cassette subfamily C protein LapB